MKKYDEILEMLLNKINKNTKKISKEDIELINKLFNDLPIELKENIFLLQIRKGNLLFFEYLNMNKDLLYNFEINPFHFALNMGDTKILKKLLEYSNINNINFNDSNQGFNLTLLEKACLNKDANSIDILQKYGANMEKHIIFRESKYKLKIECLDIANLCYFILKLKITNKIDKLKFLHDYVDFEEEYPFEGIKIKKIIEAIELILGEHLNEYIKLLKKDLLLLEDNCNFDIIILYTLPFIGNNLNYPYTIENENLIITELFYLILLNYKNNKFIDNYKKNIYDKLNEYYLKKKLFKEDHLGILLKKSFKLFNKNI
jgi:hypothetical protein